MAVREKIRGRTEAAKAGDEIAAAREAGLRYVTDDRPGITRRRAGRGFSYRDPFGKRISDRAEIERIRGIGIPPAWTNVWICPNPRGHIQATGRDARGRKQYRYHTGMARRSRCIEVRALARVRGGAADPAGAHRSRPRAAWRAARAGSWRQSCGCIDRTLMRVGNEEYARTNDSYGATTLRKDHVEIEGAEVALQLSRQGRQGAPHRLPRPAHRRDPSALPGAARRVALLLRRRAGRGAHGRLR